MVNINGYMVSRKIKESINLCLKNDGSAYGAIRIWDLVVCRKFQIAGMRHLQLLMKYMKLDSLKWGYKEGALRIFNAIQSYQVISWKNLLENG